MSPCSRLLVIFTVMPSKVKLETFQYRKSRIWDLKEDKYTKSLAKNQVSAILAVVTLQTFT